MVNEQPLLKLGWNLEATDATRQAARIAICLHPRPSDLDLETLQSRLFDTALRVLSRQIVEKRLHAAHNILLVSPLREPCVPRPAITQDPQPMRDVASLRHKADKYARETKALESRAQPRFSHVDAENLEKEWLELEHDVREMSIRLRALRGLPSDWILAQAKLEALRHRVNSYNLPSLSGQQRDR